MKTQNERIKNHLQRGRRITALDALTMFGCFRLASRIYDLRDEGLEIENRMILTKTGKWIAQYFIPKDKR